MNTRIISLCLAIPFLAGCTSYRNLKAFDISHDHYRSLVVIYHPTGSTVGLADDNNDLHIITKPMYVGGPIDDVVVSPEGKRGVFVSSGEGHQNINVFSFDHLVDLCEGEVDAFKPLRILDPYPYELVKIRWVSEITLEFSSPSDFYLFDKRIRRGAYDLDQGDKVWRTWRWNVDKDEFTEFPNQARR